MPAAFAPPTTLAELEALRESWDFEAKLARGRDQQGEVPRTFWETYSAFANTEGGWVILGAKERADHTLTLAGVGDAVKVEKELWDNLSNRQKVSANLLGQGDVTAVTIDGHTILVVRVPKAGRSERPVFINGSWETGTFVRVHEGDHRVERDVARRMLADAQPNRDSEVLAHTSMDDLDLNGVRVYREMFATLRREHPFVAKSDAGFLEAVGALRSTPARSGLTVAGLVMFGLEQAIRDRYPHWHLSYREEPADRSLGVRWLDRVVEDGTWEANIFNFYLRVMPKLLAHVKTRFALDRDMFRVDEGPVHEAVREAFVNTLVHADYEGTMGVRAIRHPNSFEFVNPGLPLVSVEQLWRGGTSDPRNPALQQLFRHVLLGEREGSGGPAILQAWAREQWQRPVFRLDPDIGQTTLELSQESLLPASVVEALEARWGRAFRELDSLGRSILVFSSVEGELSHARIMEVTSAHSRDVTLKLQELVRRKWMVALGDAKTKRYALAGVERPARTSLLDPPSAIGATSSLIATSSASTATSSPTATSSASTATSSAAAGPELAGRVVSAILLGCNEDFLTAAEIATRVGRSVETVRQNYLPGLTASGQLELRYPDTPRHPQQAYRTRGDP